MRLSDYLHTGNIIIGLKAQSKAAAIEELTECLQATGLIRDKADFIKHVLEREQLGSTGIGNHVAIPHTTTVSVSGLVVAFGRSAGGIDFSSLDGEEVNHIFLMGTNHDNLNVYLRVLAQLSRMLNDKLFRQEFSQAATAEEILEVIRKYEKSSVAVTR